MSNTIETVCLECKGRFAVPASAAGKKIRCPKCQGVISVKVTTSSKPQRSVTTSPVERPAVRRPKSQNQTAKPTPAASDRPQTNSQKEPIRSRRPVRPEATHKKRSQPKKPLSRSRRVGSDSNAFHEARDASQYVEPQQRLPGRRKKKAKPPSKPRLKKAATMSYNQQRMASIGLGLLFMLVGGAWIYLQFQYGDRIRIYPFILVGAGFINTARSLVDD